MKQTDKTDKSDINGEDGFTTVRHHSALPLWACSAVWVIAALFFPMYRLLHYVIIAAVSISAAVIAYILDRGYDENIKKPEVKTGSADADSIRTALSGAEVTLHQLINLLPVDKAPLAAMLEKLCRTLSKISDDLREDPDDARLCKRLTSYYMPLIEKLCGKYAFVIKQSEGGGGETGALGELSAKLEGAFAEMNSALEKLCGALYANDELDISTDIDVMNELLRRSGLE